MVRNEAIRVEARRLAGPPFHYSYREIAERMGKSKGRISQLLRPYNQDGRALRYQCRRCGKQWFSAAKSVPSRCPPAKGGCGSLFWQTADGDTSVRRRRRPASGPAL